MYLEGPPGAKMNVSELVAVKGATRINLVGGDETESNMLADRQWSLREERIVVVVVVVVVVDRMGEVLGGGQRSGRQQH